MMRTMSLYDRLVTTIPRASTTPVPIPPCPVCRNEQALPMFAIEGMTARVVACTECGLGILHPQPSAAEIARSYSPEYYGDTGTKFVPLVEVLVRFVGARRARFLAKGLPQGARVLDVGCGRGVLLGALADRGCEVHGVELSEEAIQGADPRAHIRIAAHLADAHFPAEFFDRVIVWHVLEHLPDPRGTLQEIHHILKPGGQVVVAVPNFSSWQARWAGDAWFHLDLPRHLFHFPLSALRRLLTACHFECQSTHHFSLRQNPFGWLQSYLNRRPSLLRNGLYVMLQSRSDQQVKLFSRRTRVMLRLAYWLGMPVALVFSVLATLCRSGATVHVVAKTARLSG